MYSCLTTFAVEKKWRLRPAQETTNCHKTRKSLTLTLGEIFANFTWVLENHKCVYAERRLRRAPNSSSSADVGKKGSLSESRFIRGKRTKERGTTHSPSGEPMTKRRPAYKGRSNHTERHLTEGYQTLHTFNTTN